MTAFPELFVLRHGQTEWNAANRQQGQQDSPLTETGRAQARDQGEILRAAGLADRPVAAFASPLGRARQTADIVLAAIGATAVIDGRLMEVGFGDWEGLTGDQIDTGWPGSRDGDPFFWNFDAPGGEDFAAVSRRAAAFLADLTGPAVLVTHGITSRVLRGLWLGLDQAGISDLPGGQGVVYHLKDGRHARLEP